MITRLTGIGVALVLFSVGAFADTIPGGDVSGNWYRSHSPYYIAGNITVPAGDTLTIEPAVVVNFLGTYSFTVNGWLEAVGTETDSIRFAGGGIAFTNAPDTSHLVYCSLNNSGGVVCNNSNPVISHSSITGIGGQAAIEVPSPSCPRISDCRLTGAMRGIYWTSSANATIDRCVISNTSMMGLYSMSASGTISGSTISGCHRSGVYKYSGNLTFIDCTISNNTNDIDDYGGGVHSRNGNLTFTNCTISNDSTHTGGGGGVGCRNGTATFTNCTINGNFALDLSGPPRIGGGGISLYHANAVLSHCTLFDNWAAPCGGIAIDTGSLSIDHCTIDRNVGDVTGSPGTGISIIGGGTTADITNSIVSNNHPYGGRGYGIYNQGTLTVDYSDFYGNDAGPISGNMPPGFGVLDTTNHNGDSCDVYYNIFLDPMFVDTVNRDYHLLAGSPCIDAGDPASPKDPDSTIADLGRYYFNQGSGVEVSQPLRLTPHASRLTVFPNPFASFASVPGHASERFSLYDISGRKVGVFQGDRVGEGLSAGVYFLRKADGSSQPLRIVKVR
jgi:Right handed beta helix region